MCTCISVIPEAIKKCIFDEESLKEMEKKSVISIGVASSPQPGSQKNRERDGILVRDGIGKGAGFHDKIPQSRYMKEGLLLTLNFVFDFS